MTLWGAAIVVAASRGCYTTLPSDDLGHGQKLLNVEIVIPFR